MKDIIWSDYGNIIVFLGAAYVLLDQYRIRRDRMVERWKTTEGGEEKTENNSLLSSMMPGIDAKSELSTAAKYALWKYMFSILAVGGTVIGILSGIAGYMIKDLATEKAMRLAVNEMRKPLNDLVANFANADAAFTIATHRVSAGDSFPKSVAEALFTARKSEIRGDPGPKGQDGNNGNDGRPGADAVTADVVKSLFDKHGAELRGPPGENGKSADIRAVADDLAARYATQLRGVAGPKGQDGKNGMDGKPGTDAPSAKAVAAELVKNFSTELRGPPGKEGATPEAGKVAESLANQFRDQLRGPPGKDGIKGGDGRSPRVADVALALWEDHRDEILQSLRRVRLRSR